MPAPLLPASPPHARARLTALLRAALIASLGVSATALVSAASPGPAPAASTWLGSPRPGLSVAVGLSGTTVSTAGARLSLAAENAGGQAWRRVAAGMQRPTPFGAETVTVSDRRAEESETVERRQGPTSWRWRIDAPGATARLGVTGVVSFARPPRVLPFAIQPVRILDARGRDVTPAGLQWTLGRDRRGMWLGLRLDDRGLSVPYTIDPAITFDASASGANTSAPASPATLTINVPAGVAANDLLVAQVVVNGGTSSTITPPAGWTLTRRTNNTTSVGEASFRKVAGGSEPASYTWTISDSSDVPRATGSMLTYTGIDDSDPMDITSATNSGSSASVAAAPVSTSANGELVVGYFGTDTGTTFLPPAGMIERAASRNPSGSGPSAEMADLTQVIAGSSGARTATAGASAPFVTQLVAYNLDAAAPSGTLTAPAAGASVHGAVDLVASSADTGSGVASATFQVAGAGGGGWTTVATDTDAPYQASWDTLAVADGLYDLRLVTTDNAGNATTSTSPGVRVDNLVPAAGLSLVSVAPSGSAVLAGSTIYYRGAAGGSLQLSSAVADAGSGPASSSFPALAGPAAGWSHLGQTVSAPDGGPYPSGPFSWAAGTVGSPTEAVQAADAAGNTVTATLTFVDDSAAPVASMLAPADGGVLRGSTSLVASAVDAGSGVTGVAFQSSPSGAGAWTPIGSAIAPPYSAGWDTSHVADGLYDLRAVATDAVGNSAPSAAVTVRVDNTAPVAAITVPADGASVRGSVLVSAGVADAGSGAASAALQRSRAGAAVWTTVATVTHAPFQASWDTTGVADGRYDLRVVATDSAGNSTVSAVPVQVLADNTAPTATLTAPIAGSQLRGAVTLAAGPADSGSGVANAVFQRSPAGAEEWTAIATATAVPYTVSWDTSGLSDGSYDLRVVTTDVAGNTAMDSVSPVHVDNTAPATWLNDPGADVRGPVDLQAQASDTGSGVASVEFQRSPAGAGTWSPIATATAAPYTAQLDTASIADGLYDLRVVTTDAAGNTSVHLIAGVRVDNTAPAVTEADASALVRATAQLHATASDAGSGVAAVEFQLSPPRAGNWTTVGSASAAPYSVSVDTTALADGSYDLRAVARDIAGNWSASEPVLSVAVDNTPPVIWLADLGAHLRGPVELQAQASDAGSGVASVEFQRSPAGAGSWTPIGADSGRPSSVELDTTGLADGPYDVRVVAADAAGNTSASAPARVLVDNTSPTLELTAPAPGARVSGSVPLGAAAVDAGTGVASVTFRVHADGGAWVALAADADGPFAADWDSTTMPDGAAQVEAVAVDAAGNTSVVTQAVTVDNQPPTVDLAELPGLARGRLDLAASASADTVQVDFQARRQGGGWMSLGSDSPPLHGLTVDTAWMADGAYDLRAVATDAAGHTGASGTAQLMVDNTAPAGWLTASGGGAAVAGAPVDVTGSAADATTGVASIGVLMRPAGGAFAPVGSASGSPYTVRWDTVGLPPGVYELEAQMRDRAGNTSVTPVVRVTLAAPAAPLSFSFTPGPVAVTAHGANALLRFAVSSSASASLQATLNRGTRMLHRWRVATPAGKRTLSLALPKRLLTAGTYRLVVSAAGPSGQTVVRTVVVHVPAHLKQA